MTKEELIESNPLNIATINYQLRNQIGTCCFQSITIEVAGTNIDFSRLEKTIESKESEIREKYKDSLYKLETKRYY